MLYDHKNVIIVFIQYFKKRFHISDDADDPVGQLEQQVMGSNGLISQQQAEICQLQGICINLQKVTHSLYLRQCVQMSLCQFITEIQGDLSKRATVGSS